MTYSTLKVACIVGAAVLLGRVVGGVEAAMGGFALASVLVARREPRRSRRVEPGTGRFPSRELISFQVFTMAFNLGVTLVARLDLQLLQAFLGEGARSGDYKAAQAIATIPYQAVFAITFVLFPLVSGAAARDPARVRTYTAESTRYALIIAALVALCFAGAPRAAVTLLYPAEYASAGARAARPRPRLPRVLALLHHDRGADGGGPPAREPRCSSRSSSRSRASDGALLIPRFGGVGIATATAVAMAVGFVARAPRARPVRSEPASTSAIRADLARRRRGLAAPACSIRDGAWNLASSRRRRDRDPRPSP